MRAGVTQHSDSPQLASWGRRSFSPFAHASTVPMSCPNGSAASLDAFVSPLASDGCITHSIGYGSKGPIKAVLFVDTGICSAHCKSRETAETRRNGFAVVPREPVAGCSSLPPGQHGPSPGAGMPSVCPLCRLLACHASLNFNSPEPHTGPQGNQGGLSINYLLNLDKYYNK